MTNEGLGPLRCALNYERATPRYWCTNTRRRIQHPGVIQRNSYSVQRITNWLLYNNRATHLVVEHEHTLLEIGVARPPIHFLPALPRMTVEPFRGCHKADAPEVPVLQPVERRRHASFDVLEALVGW